MISLSDNQVHERLNEAIKMLSDVPCETIQGSTALETAVKNMQLLQLGLIMAQERSEAKNDP